MAPGGHGAVAPTSLPNLGGRQCYGRDEHVDVGPGAVIFIPRGTQETFEPTTTLRMIVVYLPGGMDGFFAEAGEPAARREVPAPLSQPPDVDKLSRIGARYGLQVQAPPGV